MLPLIVFSHLRWNFACQRPRHLPSRLVRHHRVVFIEEPVYGAGAARMVVSMPRPNDEVPQPRPQFSWERTAAAAHEAIRRVVAGAAPAAAAGSR